MPAEFTDYFTAEKQEALLFMVVGVLAILITAWMIKTSSRFRAAGFPLVAIAAIQITVGSTVYFRTDAQVGELTSLYEKDVTSFQSEEIPRMQVVIDNFVLYRWIEIALLFAGTILVVLLRKNPRWLAVGLGLTLQSAIMLGLDYFAEARAAEYMQFILGLA